MERLYLGIDIGTSALKIVLIDENRQILSEVSEEYQLSQPQDGWNEMNQEIWFEKMVHGIHRVLDGRERSCLKSIGITGQMHTLIVLDENGGYIRPALMWNDLRTKGLVPELKEAMASFEEGDYLSRTVSTGSPASNLYWLKKHEPENFAKIGKFLIGPDYLIYRLTGCYGTDYCGASTSCLYEIKNRKWSAEMREFLGLNESVYPEIRPSARVAGTVTAEMAKILEIPEDVTVLAGTGDNPATAISTGCLGKGYPVISLGTSGVLITPVDASWDHKYGKRILFSFNGKEFFNLVQGTVQSNGSTLEWWVRKVLGSSDFLEIDRRVDLQEQKKNGIIFYPHLNGEKTLYADPSLRGAFIGMSVDSSQADLTYAVIEGLCFGVRELSEKMALSLKDYGSVMVVGGGSKSRVWMQTMANVLNLPVEKMEGMVGAAFGMALLAAYCDSSSTTVYTGIAEKTICVQERFEPDPEMVKVCDQKYQLYERMHDGLKYITDGEASESA